MAKAFITEFGARRKDSNGRTLPYPNHPPLASQAVSISDTSAQSAAFQEHTRFIRISADVACAYRVGENPTATEDDAALAADEIEYIGVRGGDKVALVSIEEAAPPEPTIWNPADKHADITLSSGDLVATRTAQTVIRANARSTNPKTSGKHYWEVTVEAITTPPSAAFIATAIASDLLSGLLGSDDNTAAYFGDGFVSNGINSTTIATYTAGDVLGCAIDLDAGEGWFSKNGVFASGDPVTGTGPHFTFTAGTTIYPALMFRNSTDELTANFGATAFNTSPPTGFSAWDA
jgi:hypothetical protein